MKKTNLRKSKSQAGITLIALVVTIVVLLILAAISINLILGDDGIFGKASDAKNKWNQAEQNDLDALDSLFNQMENILNGTGGGSGTGENTTDPGTPEEETKSSLVLLMEKQEISEDNVEVEDEFKNKVVIPAGFTVVAKGKDGVEYKYEKDAGGNSTGNPVVQDGIVIEDREGNQFVWVPVGTIKNDKVENTTNTTTITLGRYTFASDGAETLVQNATNYTQEVAINDYYYKELAWKELATSTYGNSTALNLGEWINQANTNGGYYIGRYEASKNSTDNTKAASKSAAVWNKITQPAASTAAKAMYQKVDENTKVYSDLINSYAWDTAIVFIQEYSGDNDYSRQKSKNTSLSLENTGERTGTTDKVCNIYDMASNTMEWTTEFFTYSYYPCTSRGGSHYYSDYYTSDRYYGGTSDSDDYVSFRSTLYVK